MIRSVRSGIGIDSGVILPTLESLSLDWFLLLLGGIFSRASKL